MVSRAYSCCALESGGNGTARYFFKERALQGQHLINPKSFFFFPLPLLLFSLGIFQITVMAQLPLHYSIIV